jgi:hypothetical protein
MFGMNILRLDVFLLFVELTAESVPSRDVSRLVLLLLPPPPPPKIELARFVHFLGFKLEVSSDRPFFDEFLDRPLWSEGGGELTG